VKAKTKIIAILALTELLVACSGQQPSSSVYRPSVVKRQTQAQTNRIKPYIPSPTLSDQALVSDVVETYGKQVAGKLSYYFTKAKVTYPPKEITFVALKQEKKLELWARDNGAFRHILDYNIMAASGDPGPKLRQGDRQVPEGVYRITSLNPNSNYHLSMKINYPNEFDLYHAEQEGRYSPGGDIFIHGKALSIGCLAMGDAAIEELFVLTALVGTDNVKVVIAPHDPRAYPLKVDSDELPTWTPALYSTISREIEFLSPLVKSEKLGNKFQN
jgi:murein L,D-transpeptidase YafK